MRFDIHAMGPTDDAEEIAKMLAFIPQLQSMFVVKEKVGEGTFSKVYRAEVKGETPGSRMEYALKYLVPTSLPSRIASELLCLKEVGGSCNIVGVELSIMHKGHVVIVMPYFPHQRFVDYVKLLTSDEIKEYMKNLFVSLDKVHSHGIIHRDIKPNNFLYNRYQRRYALVDFGLAQRMQDVSSVTFASVTQPFKDHNALPLHERLNKSESAPVDVMDSEGRTDGPLNRPYQSTPIVVPKKRAYCGQENNGNPSKKMACELLQNGDWQTSSKVNILPTPPLTPSRCSLSVTKIKKSRSGSGQVVIDAKQQNETSNQKQCLCFGKDTVCKICLSRIAEEAPRGGTPGFRAPEVLLKHKEQSTAIDMWSAGVILLSILSKKYPFFRAEDDLTALAEIIFLVGMKEMEDAALSLGKKITLNLPQFSEEVTDCRKELGPPMYLRLLCTLLSNEEMQNFREKKPKNESHLYSSRNQRKDRDVPDSAYDLLNRLLDPNPATRLTASEALLHPFIVSVD